MTPRDFTFMYCGNQVFVEWSREPLDYRLDYMSVLSLEELVEMVGSACRHIILFLCSFHEGMVYAVFYDDEFTSYAGRLVRTEDIQWLDPGSSGCQWAKDGF